MKIAIAGKGGVGKTTIAGGLARFLAEKGYKVLAIDADPDANLASALGFKEEELKGVKPLSQMKELVKERTEVTPDGVFNLNPKVDDIPDAFSKTKYGIKLLILGTIQKAGSGCFCPENALLKALLHHILVKRDEFVIVDMEAGLEHLSRGSTKGVDAFLVVVEPGQRSICTAWQIKDLAEQLGVKRIFGVGNKVNSEEDKRFIEEGMKGIPILGHFPYLSSIQEADKRGISPYDLDPKMKEEIEKIFQNLAQNLNFAPK
jgi:CO dehydrogenase maturation factor